jgi:hypothetical protein
VGCKVSDSCCLWQGVDISAYTEPLSGLLERLRREYGCSDLDALLVLKDILAGLWNEKQPGIDG